MEEFALKKERKKKRFRFDCVFICIFREIVKRQKNNEKEKKIKFKKNSSFILSHLIVISMIG
jgi:hypothetical protein